MSAADPDGDAERERFVALLQEAAENGCTISFWWRDDDAVSVTSALERLLALRKKHGVPLVLAVIPKTADEALARRLAHEPQVVVLQHGWQHANHAGPVEKKMELGEHRPVEVVLLELREGSERLRALFPRHFLPVLVPPWNRVAPLVRDARGDADLQGISTLGPTSSNEPHTVNVHIDIIDWKTRGARSRADLYGQLCTEVERRMMYDREPVGLMTHHLVHDDASWDFLDEVLSLTARHRALLWPGTAKLFDLSASN